MLVDSHCHLDFPDFAGDLDGVLARARDAGVGTMLTICTGITRFPAVRALAEGHDALYCTVGIHPHEAAKEDPLSPETLTALAQHPKVIGFGETGLDYYYEHSPRDRQQASFRAHIEAARASGLPVVIHSRSADADMAAILAEEMQAGAFTGVIHCFSAGRALAETAIKLGLYISFSGILTFPRSDELRLLAAGMPLDRLLVETDAPYLAPVPKRGKRNEPSYVAHTAATLARARNMEEQRLAEITSSNFFALFAKARRP
jgi:TatD DNase family protein